MTLISSLDTTSIYYINIFYTYFYNHARRLRLEKYYILSFLAGGVLDVKKVGRALSRTGEIFSVVERRISGFH
jgi:hypothetical protein